MAHWRRSKLVHAAVRVPFVRDLPLGVLIPIAQRIARVYYLGIEILERMHAWGRTVVAVHFASRLRDGRSRGVEIRRVFSRAWLRLFFDPASILGRAARSSTTNTADSLDARDIADERNPPAETPKPLRAIMYASSVGNFFHDEMAELIARGLATSGRFEVQRSDEHDEPGEADLHLVAAPHEFFFLGAGARFAGRRYREFRNRCSVFLAEQPGTKHFAACLPYAVEARRVLDLNADSAVRLRGLGLDAQFFPVGYVDTAGVGGQAPPIPETGSVRGLNVAAALHVDDPRPVDVLFTGVLTRRRAAFFSQHAEFFSARPCVLSLPTRLTPLQAGISSTLDRAEATALSRRSKILLNIHRDETAYFEWHRIVIRGFWERALVVSEPSPLPPGIIAGIHFIESPLDEIPETLRWLLESADGRRKADEVREAGHRVLIDEYPMSRWASRLADTIAGSARVDADGAVD